MEEDLEIGQNHWNARYVEENSVHNHLKYIKKHVSRNIKMNWIKWIHIIKRLCYHVNFEFINFFKKNSKPTHGINLIREIKISQTK